MRVRAGMTYVRDFSSNTDIRDDGTPAPEQVRR
jgi:hypothetical protein